MSSERYGQPHPLNGLVSPIMKTIPEIHLSADGPKTRKINPATFSLSETYSSEMLQHILLIDDTWTSGGTVESAAIMLKQHGAQRVTIYCLARIVDLDYCSRMIGREVTDGYSRLSYRGDCPWGNPQCQLGFR